MYLYCTTCKAFCVFVRGYLCVYVCILSWVVSGWASNVPSFTELILLISLPYFNIFFHFLFGFDFFFFFKWEKSHKIQEAADSQFAFWPQTCLPLPFSSFSVQLSPFYIFNLLLLILEFFFHLFKDFKHFMWNCYKRCGWVGSKQAKVPVPFNWTNPFAPIMKSLPVWMA